MKCKINFDFDENWKVIKDENDIKELLMIAGNFHDGVIETITYISGSYGTKEGGTMCINTRNDTSIIIAGCWNKTSIFKVELYFENTRAINVRPSMPNYDSLIDGNVFFENNYICFVDDVYVNTTKDYKYTYVIADRLKYRITVK